AFWETSPAGPDPGSASPDFGPRADPRPGRPDRSDRKGIRLLHTSDWHLGHTLRALPRDHEHQLSLAWLRDTLERESVDVLVIAGDVFETSNPPASAL